MHLSEMSLREAWLCRPLFLFACLGVVLSPSILTQFCYLCHKNGGFLFLIIFTILWILYAFPLIGIEFTLGHFLKGPIGLFGTFPILRSFGWGIIVYSLIYAPQVAWETGMYGYYFHLSVLGDYNKAVLDCKNSWNLPKNCTSVRTFRDCINSTDISKGTCPMPTCIMEHLAHLIDNNASAVVDRASTKIPDLPSDISPPMAIACAATWVIVVLFIAFGPVSHGLLSVFSIFALIGCYVALGLKLGNLPGASHGRQKGMFINFTNINDANVWGQAAVFMLQIGAMGIGIWPTLSSFNWPSTPHCQWTDLTILSICLLAALAGSSMVTFSALGYLQHVVKIKEFSFLIDRNLNLSLYTFPVVLAALPSGTQAWASVYYLACFLMGITLLVAIVEVVNSGVIHILQHMTSLTRLHIYRPLVAIGTMLVMGTLTLLFCCKHGGRDAYLFAQEYSSKLIISFVFIELLIFIAYMTIKLVKLSERRITGACCKLALLGLLIALVFQVLLGTILFLTYDIIVTQNKSLALQRNSKDPQAEQNRNQAGWILASIPLIVAGAGMVFTLLGSILFAHCNDRGLLHVLFHPRLPREPLLAIANDAHAAVETEGGGEYGQFDLGPLRP